MPKKQQYHSQGLGKNKQIKKLRMLPIPFMQPNETLKEYTERLCKKASPGTAYTEIGH
jgi:hypothetical protein